MARRLMIAAARGGSIMRSISLYTFLIATGSLAVVALTTGCDGDSTTATTTTGTAGSAGTGGTGGSGACGEAPCSACCDANSGVASDCIAIADNNGKSTYGLR